MVYYVSGAVFMLIGLGLLGWGKDFTGGSSVLVAAGLIWTGESSYQAYMKDRHDHRRS